MDIALPLSLLTVWQGRILVAGYRLKINIQSRRVALQTGECQMLISPAQPLQTENVRWIVFKLVRSTKRSEFVDVRLALFHVVRFDSAPIHSAELQSAEIRFTLSKVVA